MSTKRLTGQGTFADDHRPAGLLHVGVVRSPHPHARVLSVDASAARGLPGVVLVLGPDDAPREILGGLARYLGDRVAVVAAEDPELALRAAETLRVEYEALPAVLSVDEALAADSASGKGEGTNVAGEVRREEGAVDEAFREAERVFEGTYRVGRARLGPLEPHVVHTWLDEDQRLLVRSSTEAPHHVRVRLAERLHIPAARIRVETRMVGGGFGAKSDLRGEDLCALVTLRTARPARLALSRAEELAFAPALPAETVRLRSALRGGVVTALEIDLLVDAGVAAYPEERLLAAAADVLACYRLRDFRFRGTAVHTHNPPAAATAGRGLFFAFESHIDEIASASGTDPLELRLRQRRRVEGAAGADAEWETLEAVLAAGAREIVWSRRWKATAAQGAKRRGLGLAVARRGGAPGPRAIAQLQLGDDGSFSLRLGPSARAVDASTVLAHIAAEALGAAPEEVVVATADTDFSPPEADAVTPALATTAAAVEDAARVLRAAMIPVGARLLGVPESELVVRRGTISGPGGRSLRFAEVGVESLRAGTPLLATASREPSELPPASAAFFVEVETDAGTGQVRVVRIVAAVGCGPVAEAGLVEARIQGETLRALGHTLAGSLPDPCPTAVDEPEVVVLFVPAEGRATPFGATHTGELATRALAAAVASALAQAGPRLRDVPMTPVAFLDRVEVPSPP
jgi:putative selenate reductase molybdopterin-binding subunit